MTARNAVIHLNKGSDIRFEFAFVDDNDAPVSMIGHTIAIFAADAWGTANGSVAWTNQAGGLAMLTANWAGDPPDEVWFRVRTTRTVDGFDDAAPKLTVRWS